MRGVSVLHPRKYFVVEVGVGGYVKPVDERGREQAVVGGLLWHMVGRQQMAGRSMRRGKSMTRRSSDERMMMRQWGEMGIRGRHLSLGFTPLQNPLVYRIHDRRIRHDAHHMRAQPSIKRSNAFFGKDEFEGL